MTFPRVAEVMEGTQTFNSSNWTLTYPPLVAYGDLLLFFLASDGVPSFSPGPPSGWVGSTSAGAASACTLLFGKRYALGTETGTVNVGLTTAEQGCWKLVRVTGWHNPTIGTSFSNADDAGGSFPTGGANTGTSTTITIPSMDPFGWTTEDTMCIAAATADGGDTTVTSIGQGTPIGSLMNSGGAEGTCLAVYYTLQRVGNAASPSATISASEEWNGSVFAVRPAVAAAEPYIAGKAYAGRGAGW